MIPYDTFLLGNNQIVTEHGRENKYQSDFEFIFSRCANWFKLIESNSCTLPTRNNNILNNHNDTMDISNNFLETLNVLMKMYDLNTVETLLTFGSTNVFTYAMQHVEDSSECLRKASLRCFP